jgi:hypothetical protein
VLAEQAGAAYGVTDLEAQSWSGAPAQKETVRVAMASQQIDREKTIELINSGALHYDIIRDVAVIEMLLDAIIAYYFTTFNRWAPFADLILDRFTVTNKSRWWTRYRTNAECRHSGI